jgi:hypothetical protein
MSVKVSRNFTALSAIALTTADDMREIGLLARELIYNRTIAGTDASGQAFAPYSEGYAKAKGSTFVDLTVSGNMLNHMQIIEADEDSVSLGWEQ